MFFDSIRLAYEYEPEGFRLLNGDCYLPDFYLPEVGFFAEVKPVFAFPYEERKAEQLVRETKRNCLYLIGAPALQEYRGATFEGGDVTVTTYSLDIYMHPGTFQRGRLFAAPPYEIPVNRGQFSLEYIAAVEAARTERFGVGEAE